MTAGRKNQVRIIGGKLRGRILSFPRQASLRPTPAQVRETVFNWLMADVVGSHCLDLFAGSGAMGIEAISRQAKSVVFVDSSPSCCRSLQTELNKLSVAGSQAQVISRDAMTWLSTTKSGPFNLIFLDPPYKMQIIGPVLDMLVNRSLLAPGGLVYVEGARALEQLLSGLASWQIKRQKVQGEVHYGLLVHTPSQ